MIHLLRAVAVLGAAAGLAGLAGLAYWAAGKVISWRLPRSVLAGLAAAAVPTIWLATVRHAALVASAAQPAGDGHKISPGATLVYGFTGMFVVATVVVLAVSAVAGKRSGRRAARQDSAPATQRRGRRRAAARGWGKA